MKKIINTKKGIVGLFDILGYSCFLENNSAEDAAKIIIEDILDINKNVIDQYGDLFRDIPSEQNIKDILNKIEWLVFSDTILLTLPYDNEKTKDLKDIYWSLFCGVVGRLFAHLFLKGLPIRGAITYGEYFVGQNCFAGKSIVDAYQATKKIDLSAVVFIDQGIDELKKIDALNSESLTSMQLFEYLIPLKTEHPKKFYSLRVPVRALEINSQTDIRQKILESFWGHQKDIHPNASKKIDNTEYYFRHVVKIAKDKI